MKIIIRLSGDLVIKSVAIRRRFQNKLKSNIKIALDRAGVRFHMSDAWNRFYLESPQGEEAITALKNVFGIQSISPVDLECGDSLEEILKAGDDFYKEKVWGKTFEVRAHRCGHKILSSKEVNYQLGSLLNQPANNSKVKLDDPDVSIHIDMRETSCYFYSRIILGARGLPLGTQGRTVCLLSGGFDSPVAAWMMQKRGVDVDFLFCNLAAEAQERAIIKLAHKLQQQWGHGSSSYLHIVDFKPIVAALKEKVSTRYLQVILKRMFYRIAELQAKATQACAIVTGEALGQVSSQTLINLSSIEEAISTPVLRPLIGFDKNDIISISRAIGTYEESAHQQEYCQLVPQKPSTACSIAKAREEEDKLDLSILATALANRKTIYLSDQSCDASLLASYIFVDQLPEKAEVIDCQSEEQFLEWHHPTAQHHEFFDLQNDFKKLAKEKVYLLYCQHGTQSALLAEMMQNQGYEAYSFIGGVKALRLL